MNIAIRRIGSGTEASESDSSASTAAGSSLATRRLR